MQSAHRHLCQVLIGLLFVTITIGCMTIRLHVAEGVIVDQRNVLIILGTLFGGPLPGMMTALGAAAFRIYLGGGGVFGGVVGILLSFSAGMIWRFWRRERDFVFFFVGAAALVPIVLLGFLFVGDWANGWALLRKMAIPYGISIFLGMALVGLLLQREENRIHAEEQVQRSEKKYRQLYESIVDISFEVDNQGVLRMVSPSITTILGYTPEEVTGQSIVNLFCDPSQHALLREEVYREGAVQDFQALFHHKNRTDVWLSVNGRLLDEEQGQKAVLHGLARDITRIKKAEEEKALLEQSLTQSRKMEAIGTLAGGIAHDFNNILAGIMGYVEMLQRDLHRQKTERMDAYLHNILVATERAQNLVRQILAFSRQSALEMRPVEMREVVQDVIVLMRASLPSTIAIEQSLNTESRIMADKGQIHQVIMNLCTNAGHAMKENGGRLTLNLDEVTLDHQFTRRHQGLEPGVYVRLQVGDTGKGIPGHLLERIFDPFFTTKKPGEGTGLGLSMVHGIVTGMHGLITVESQKGQGTLFNLYLPRTESAADTAEEEKTLPNGNEHVVIVDDDPFLTEIGDALLKELGYGVTCFNDSREALQFILDHRQEVDMVITDMTMPAMTGLDLAERLRANRITLPILLCTGNNEGITEEHLRRANIQKCLIKPLTSHSLAGTVRSILDGRAAA